jgi:hypothetical protein
MMTLQQLIQLEKLTKLRQEGMLSEAEFERSKAELLAKAPEAYQSHSQDLNKRKWSWWMVALPTIGCFYLMAGLAKTFFPLSSKQIKTERSQIKERFKQDSLERPKSKPLVDEPV